MFTTVLTKRSTHRFVASLQ